MVSADDEVILLFAAATDYRGFAGRQLSDPLAATSADLDQVEDKTFAQLRSAQQADHEKYFNRVTLSLPATANSQLPTDERLATYRDQANGSRSGCTVCQLGTLPTDRLVTARRLACKSSGNLGR